MTKLYSLSIQNYARIRGVELVFDPKDHVFTIAGANGSGKTSVLDAIMVCLVGPRVFPPMPVHQGAEMAELITDIGDAVVTRKIKPDGSMTLKVALKDGTRGNQGWLDKKLGAMSFDPLAFTRLDAKAQAEALRKLVGVDVVALDDEHKRVFDERTGVKRELRNSQGVLESLPPEDPNAPAEEVSAQTLVGELQEAMRLASEKQAVKQEGINAKAMRDATDVKRQYLESNLEGLDAKIKKDVSERERTFDRDIERLEEQLRKLKSDRQGAIDAVVSAGGAERDDLLVKLSETKNSLVEHDVKLKAIRAKYDAINVPNVEELKGQLAKIEITNRDARAVAAHRADREKAKVIVDDLTKRIDAMTERLAKIAAERQAKIANAKYPIEGLSFDDWGAVVFNNVPLSQASQAEQIRVSMAIGLAANPELRVMCVREGALLDAKSRALVHKIAEEADAQVFLEVVESTDPDTIFIEDGAVKAS